MPNDILEVRPEDRDALEKGAFPWLWELVRQQRLAHIRGLLDEVETLANMDEVTYFANTYIELPDDLCQNVLPHLFERRSPWTVIGPEGLQARATFAYRYGKPWAIRLAYYNCETHIDLDWKKRSL